MFFDEARFGRYGQLRRCWVPPGIRPEVTKQVLREYTYIYRAVSPVDGVANFLVLPQMTAFAMNIFLAEIKARHPNELILMIGDQASSHSETALVVPENLVLEKLPPYCPQLNPVENIWDDMREKFFPNFLFETLSAVEETLVDASLYYESSVETIKSITGFDWIINNILNATWYNLQTGS